MQARDLNLTKCYELDDETLMHLKQMYDNPPIRNLTGQLKELDVFLLQRKKNIGDSLKKCETELDARTKTLNNLNTARERHIKQALQQKEVKYKWQEEYKYEDFD
eukprot:CAMPEP_0116916766 /NCGR_PEP_ID=MMETSP0467-20121206/18734_1 /TAXON_ID=283647 /ORGANISM="Mesodinium pulex, Strain SPMC105" /LENGTH=104 /DNA_ID=CAMNT_0004593713 /DNA_START=1012 /DNA_END=1326 /DNA_ORIENTATION=+